MFFLTNVFDSTAVALEIDLESDWLVPSLVSFFATPLIRVSFHASLGFLATLVPIDRPISI
jgi:hypothetical protein